MKNEADIAYRHVWTALTLSIEESFEVERLALLEAEDRLFYNLPNYLSRKV